MLQSCDMGPMALLGTDGFTFPPKKGMLRNFSPEKSNGFG
jgi:hypothetical protein